MGNSVLFGRFHLRGSEFFARFRGAGGLIVGHEQWIISEAMLAMRLVQQHARHFADFHSLAGNRITTVGTGASFGFRHHQCGRAAETCGTLGVRNVGDLREQQRIIGFVVAMLARPTCGKNAGGIAHHINDQAGIVGDRRAARACGHIAGLEQRILLEGHAVLHRIRQIQRAGGNQLHLIRVRTQAIFQNAIDFNEFAFVMGCDDDSHVPIPFVAVRYFVDVGLPDVPWIA